MNKENNEILSTEKPNLFNIQAEQIVLGTIILNNDYLWKVIEILNKEHFYEPAHQIIFKNILNTTQKLKIVADSVSLKNFFDNDELIKTIGGSKYLSILLSFGAGIVDIVDYARIIQDLSIKRKLVFIGEEIVNDAYKKASKTTANTQIENASDKLFLLEENLGIKTDLEHFVNCSAEEVHDEKVCLEDPELRLKDLIRTGFRNFDYGDPAFRNSNFDGFFKKDLNILAGVSSMGKTTLALQIVLNVINQNRTVAFFSLEMSKKSVIQKILANLGEINSKKIKARNLTKEEFDTNIINLDKITRKDLYISDATRINPNYIDKNLKKLAKLKKIIIKNGKEEEVSLKADLVVIDYLQLMTPNSKQGNRHLEISSITKDLKAIAKKFDCCILCLSQLSRGLNNRENKIPQLSDLKESGDIENDSDMVMFVYRKVYYLEQELKKLNTDDTNYRTKRDDLKNEIKKIENDCDLLIRKNRNGNQYGDIKLSFYPEYSLVKDREYKEEKKQFRG